jgi:hypothetical protein
MDFSKLYNTQLSPEEEAQFQQWAQKNNKLNDLQDYDLKGFWKDNQKFSDNGHGSDTYKKPNHPTFSDQSKYHGVNGLEGGQWDEDSFTASPTNTIFRSPEELQDYFNKVEPNVNLKFKKIREKLGK